MSASELFAQGVLEDNGLPAETRSRSKRTRRCGAGCTPPSHERTFGGAAGAAARANPQPPGHSVRSTPGEPPTRSRTPGAPAGRTVSPFRTSSWLWRGSRARDLLPALRDMPVRPRGRSGGLVRPRHGGVGTGAGPARARLHRQARARLPPGRTARRPQRRWRSTTRTSAPEKIRSGEMSERERCSRSTPGSTRASPTDGQPGRGAAPLGDLDGAETAYRRALEDDPEIAPAYHTCGAARAARAGEEAKDAPRVGGPAVESEPVELSGVGAWALGEKRFEEASSALPPRAQPGAGQSEAMAAVGRRRPRFRPERATRAAGSARRTLDPPIPASSRFEEAQAALEPAEERHESRAAAPLHKTCLRSSAMRTHGSPFNEIFSVFASNQRLCWCLCTEGRADRTLGAKAG